MSNEHTYTLYFNLMACKKLKYLLLFQKQLPLQIREPAYFLACSKPDIKSSYTEIKIAPISND